MSHTLRTLNGFSCRFEKNRAISSNALPIALSYVWLVLLQNFIESLFKNVSGNSKVHNWAGRRLLRIRFTKDSVVGMRVLEGPKVCALPLHQVGN